MKYSASEGEVLAADTFVRRALNNETFVSTELVENDELLRLGLSAQAPIRTPVPRALLMKVTMPVISGDEKIVGTIQAGYLLNHGYDHFLNEIKRQTGLNPSILLGNVRIASTIPQEEGILPVGRVMDIPGTRQVLANGTPFLGQVEVIRTHHQAGYAPIRDSAGRIIGMHGIGIPEVKIFALRDRLIFFFICALAAAIALSLYFGLKGGARVVSSIHKLRRGIEAFGRGDLMHRVDIRSQDELEELGNFFNLTMAQLISARKQIEDASINIGRLEDTVQKGTIQLEMAQKKLVACERMAAMGRMATALSHELRNTFAEISTGIYALKHRLSEAGQKEMLSTVESLKISLDHATTILSNVLTFSYPRKPILSSVDMNYLIDDLLAMPTIREMFRKSGVKVEKAVHGHIPAITADGLQLREMFSNIIINGIQAMEGGGRLALAVNNDGAAIRVTISDTGPGIPAETMKELFTPFFTTKSRGLGLGLCISRTIAEEHGGTIEVASSGKGTTFTISIPAAGQGASV
jgi:two-component system NtrC family sensor kinase